MISHVPGPVMSCTRIALLLSIVLLTAGPHPASAGFETIEWTISDADMVVVGLLERPTRPGIGRVRVTETIKGIPAESLTFIYATNVQEHRVSACAAPMLLSVKTWKRHFGTDPVPGVPGCVLIPTDCNTSAITLDGSPPQPRSHPFLGSSSPEELLRRARLAARASSDGPAKPFPAQTILADKNGWLLDDLYVLLPANESALEVLGSWARSDQVHARHHAAWLIGVLGHPEGIPHLLRLLDDPFVDPGGWDQFSTNLGWGRWRVTQYPIRRAAWDSLQKLGYVGPAPLIRQPVLARRALPIWMLSLPAMPIVIGLLVAALVRTRRTSTGISAASLVLMMLFALLWVRSYRTTDDLAWDAQGRVREFWSHEGGLYYLETSVFNLNRPLSWGQFDGRGPLRPMWKLTGRAEPGSFWGFEHRADYKGASWGIVGTTRGRRVPHWAAVGLFAIPPFLWLRAVYAAAVRPWGARPGFCTKCGYDLRATPAPLPRVWNRGAPPPAFWT